MLIEKYNRNFMPIKDTGYETGVSAIIRGDFKKANLLFSRTTYKKLIIQDSNICDLNIGTDIGTGDYFISLPNEYSFVSQYESINKTGSISGIVPKLYMTEKAYMYILENYTQELISIRLSEKLDSRIGNRELDMLAKAIFDIEKSKSVTFNPCIKNKKLIFNPLSENFGLYICYRIDFLYDVEINIQPHSFLSIKNIIKLRNKLEDLIRKDGLVASDFR